MSQRRAWGIEEQSATVGEESVLVMIISPLCGWESAQKLACSKNKYTPRSATLLCGMICP